MNHFWETKKLTEMSRAEWESLCDGCGRCCLHKLEDEETHEIYNTSVACQLLDLNTCRCTNYAQRTTLISDCLELFDIDFYQYEWLPKTCAYRLLHEKKSLPLWHPLVSNNPKTVITAGISISHFAISENTLDNLDNLEDYVTY